jgi:hypothetical protein
MKRLLVGLGAVAVVTGCGGSHAVHAATDPAPAQPAVSASPSAFRQCEVAISNVLTMIRDGQQSEAFNQYGGSLPGSTYQEGYVVQVKLAGWVNADGYSPEQAGSFADYEISTYCAARAQPQLPQDASYVPARFQIPPGN